MYFIKGHQEFKIFTMNQIAVDESKKAGKKIMTLSSDACAKKPTNKAIFGKSNFFKLLGIFLQILHQKLSKEIVGFILT